MGAAAVPFILTAVTVASTAYSAYTSIQAGKEQKEEKDRQAAMAKAAAAREYADTEKQHKRIIGAQEARYGAAGVTMEGSPLLVQYESMKESKEQLRRITEAGENQASVFQSEGEQALRSGYAGGIKNLLGGAKSTFQTGRSYDWW